MSEQKKDSKSPPIEPVIAVRETKDKSPEKREQQENHEKHVRPLQPKTKPFSWLEPHAIFVIVLVGEEQRPFGIQKDFLCDRSEFFRDYFASGKDEVKVEHVVKLPETTPEIFGLVQNYLFTGAVISDASNVPPYESLVGLWKLGHKLVIKGLCDKALEAMVECRRITNRIPATPLLIKVWKETPEGSTIRKLLLSWTAEYMRSSDARAEFAKSLPQEVLSELVITMSSMDAAPPALPVTSPVVATSGISSATPQKNVHYLEDDDEEDSTWNRKARRAGPGAPSPASEKLASRIKVKQHLPKPVAKARTSTGFVDSRLFTTSQKLEFCADLLTRMLSGPGFWTRLVGPFREPVEPVEDGVPDYLEKIKRPMDLSTMKAKMDRKEYANEEEFVADMRQIFDNCFTYWSKGDPIWVAGEKLQKTFEDKYSTMNKWIAKMGGEEGE